MWVLDHPVAAVAVFVGALVVGALALLWPERRPRTSGETIDLVGSKRWV